MNSFPLVSVIIPCYQEKDFIRICLDSLIDNGYPREKLEILVMDGGSTDGTRETVKKYEKSNQGVKLLDNPCRYRPFALNKGLREAKGEIIIACDAHAEYECGYIQKLTERLKEDKTIGNAGGVWIHKPANRTLKAEAIAYALESPLCVGPNRYRTGVKEPTDVDTVPFGAWRREVFDEVGYFDEDFLRAADLEHNIRIKRVGYRIVLDPSIKIYYYPRENFSKLFGMMYQYGYWKNLVNKKLRVVSSVRQFGPVLFILYLASLFVLFPLSRMFVLPLLLYFFLLLTAGLRISLRKSKLKLWLNVFVVFLFSHIGYGTGYLKGFWDIFLLRKKLSKPGLKITR